MQRDHSGLHAESEEEQQEHRALLPGRKRRGGVMEGREIQASACPRQNEEPNQQQAGARVRHDQKQHPRPARPRLFVFETHQCPCR